MGTARREDWFRQNHSQLLNDLGTSMRFWKRNMQHVIKPLRP